MRDFQLTNLNIRNMPITHDKNNVGWFNYISTFMDFFNAEGNISVILMPKKCISDFNAKEILSVILMPKKYISDFNAKEIYQWF